MMYSNSLGLTMKRRNLCLCFSFSSFYLGRILYQLYFIEFLTNSDLVLNIGHVLNVDILFKITVLLHVYVHIV